MALGVIAAFIFCSFVEWALHRYVMHQPVGKFTYPFERHALVHHQIFKADHTYHLIHEKDKETIPMAWWNGPVLVLGAVIPFAIASYFARRWGIACGALLGCGFYYGAYEYM